MSPPSSSLQGKSVSTASLQVKCVSTASLQGKSVSTASSHRDGQTGLIEEYLKGTPLRLQTLPGSEFFFVFWREVSFLVYLAGIFVCLAGSEFLFCFWMEGNLMSNLAASVYHACFGGKCVSSLFWRELGGAHVLCTILYCALDGWAHVLCTILYVGGVHGCFGGK